MANSLESDDRLVDAIAAKPEADRIDALLDAGERHAGAAVSAMWPADPVHALTCPGSDTCTCRVQFRLLTTAELLDLISAEVEIEQNGEAS